MSLREKKATRESPCGMFSIERPYPLTGREAMGEFGGAGRDEGRLTGHFLATNPRSALSPRPASLPGSFSWRITGPPLGGLAMYSMCLTPLKLRDIATRKKSKSPILAQPFQNPPAHGRCSQTADIGHGRTAQFYQFRHGNRIAGIAQIHRPLPKASFVFFCPLKPLAEHLFGRGARL